MSNLVQNLPSLNPKPEFKNLYKIKKQNQFKTITYGLYVTHRFSRKKSLQKASKPE